MFAREFCAVRLLHPLKRIIRWSSSSSSSSSTAAACSAAPTASSSSSSIPSTCAEYAESMVDEREAKQDHKHFAELFRRSKFVQLGDFEGRIVIGEIVRRVMDDLYIDIGLKFHAVCKAPAMKNERYITGAKVLVRLHDPELSELFLGSTKELTLLEADATLLGLYYSHSDESRKNAFLSTIEKEANRIKASTPEIAPESESEESVKNVVDK